MDRRSSLQEIYDDLHRQRMPEIGKIKKTLLWPMIITLRILLIIVPDLHHLHRSYILANTSHVAGFDAWTTAKILIKLAVRLKVLGFDKTISLPEMESSQSTEDAKINGKSTKNIDHHNLRSTNASRKQPEENWSRLVDLEQTPAKAIIPPWSDEFWQFFANKLRVFGTVDGVWEI